MNETIAVTGGYAKPEDRYGKIVVMGRSQSGKTTVAKRLAELTGLPVLKTSTSRPKRTPDEDTYHFYTPEEAAAIPMERKLFRTLAVDGFERWTDRDDFLAAGIAVLDPTGAEPAVRLWQAQGYRVTILYCGEPEEVRRTRWMKEFAADDGSDWDQVLAAFGHRELTEAPMFDAFEKTVQDIDDMYGADALLYPNASPEHRDVMGEDRLEQIRTSCTDVGEFLNHFLARLSGSGGLLPDRRFASGRDAVVSALDCPADEWRFLCRLLGLVPECTSEIRIVRPFVKCRIGPNAYKDALSYGDTQKEDKNA